MFYSSADEVGLQEGFSSEKEETINAVNPGPRDNLLAIRAAFGASVTINELTSREMRSQCEELIDEVSEFLAAMDAKDNQQALREGWGHVRRMVNMVNKYNAKVSVNSCDVCHSSFVGHGPTLGDAAVDSIASLTEHTEKFHPLMLPDNCSKCGHSDDEHKLAVCEHGNCACGRESAR